MKTVFFSCFFLLSILVNAQTLGLDNMVKMNKMNNDDFDTYVTKMGFKYYEYENDESKNATSYIRETKNNVEYITRFDYPIERKHRTMVSYQTTNSNIYLKFKNELKQFGYVFQEKGADDHGSYIDYKKGKIECSLNSSTQQLGSSRVSSYEISFSILR